MHSSIAFDVYCASEGDAAFVAKSAEKETHDRAAAELGQKSFELGTR